MLDEILLPVRSRVIVENKPAPTAPRDRSRCSPAIPDAPKRGSKPTSASTWSSSKTTAANPKKILDAVRDAVHAHLRPRHRREASDKRHRSARSFRTSRISRCRNCSAVPADGVSRSLTRARVQQYQRISAMRARAIMLHNEPTRRDGQRSGAAQHPAAHENDAIIGAIQGVTGRERAHDQPARHPRRTITPPR